MKPGKLRLAILGHHGRAIKPNICTSEQTGLIGTFAVYDSQSQASQCIPDQWRAFRLSHPAFDAASKLYGASPCTADGKIHYLTGVTQDTSAGLPADEQLTLAAGEYAVVHVKDAALLRDTWSWLLGEWLPASGRRERHAPEFERYTALSEAGTPVGPVEIWNSS